MSSVEILTGDRLKQNDSYPALRLQLFDDDENPQVLTGFTPTVHIRRSDSSILTVDATMTIIREDIGVVEYEWQGTDTADTGTYIGEVEIDDGSGTTMTFPNNGYFMVRITEELG